MEGEGHVCCDCNKKKPSRLTRVFSRSRKAAEVSETRLPGKTDPPVSNPALGGDQLGLEGKEEFTSPGGGDELVSREVDRVVTAETNTEVSQVAKLFGRTWRKTTAPEAVINSEEAELKLELPMHPRDVAEV